MGELEQIKVGHTAYRGFFGGLESRAVGVMSKVLGIGW